MRSLAAQHLEPPVVVVVDFNNNNVRLVMLQGSELRRCSSSRRQHGAEETTLVLRDLCQHLNIESTGCAQHLKNSKKELEFIYLETYSI